VCLTGDGRRSTVDTCTVASVVNNGPQTVDVYGSGRRLTTTKTRSDVDAPHTFHRLSLEHECSLHNQHTACTYHTHNHFSTNQKKIPTVSDTRPKYLESPGPDF